MAKCTTCSKGEGTGYQYSGRGCLYDSFEECMRINNPKSMGGFYWDTTDNCPTFFIDNADSWVGYNNTTCPAQYSFWDNTNNNGVARIPQQCVGEGNVPGGISDFPSVLAGYPMTGNVQSRLWAYDVKSAMTYYVGGLSIQGTDIGVSSNKMFISADHRPSFRSDVNPGSYKTHFINNPQNYINIGVMEYEWGWTNGQLQTLTTAATAYYRIVSPSGQLLSLASENTVGGGVSLLGEGSGSAGLNTRRERNGMGAGLATIDSQHLLLTDSMGSVFIAKTDDYYTGDFVYSFSGNPTTPYTWAGAAGSNTGIWPYAYPNLNYGSHWGIDLSNHTYQTGPYSEEKSLTDCWYEGSFEAGGLVKTIIARRIINLNTRLRILNTNYTWTMGGEHNFSSCMGDLIFTPNDPFIPASGSTGIQLGPYSAGTYTDSVIVTWDEGNYTDSSSYDSKRAISRFTFPLTSLTQSTLGNWTVQRAGLTRSRYSAYNKSVIDANNLWITDSATYNHNGGGVGVPISSVAIIKDVYTNTLYTSARGKLHEITQSNLHIGTGSQMQYTAFDVNGNPIINDLEYQDTNNRRFGFRGGAQAGDCLTSSAYTYNCSIIGCESILGVGGAFATLSACTDSCISWSCQTLPCLCPTGFTDVNGVCISTSTPTTNNGVPVVPLLPVNPNNGINGTLFYDSTLNTHQVTGPASGPFDGMFGATGDYLVNGRMNKCGVWMGSSFQADPNFSQHWYGTSKCLTASGDTRYLIGIAADNYFRISIDGVELYNTKDNPAPLGMGVIPSNGNFNNLHVIPIDVIGGTHSLTFEGWDIGAAVGTPNAAGLVVDILGPFQTNEWTATTDYSQYTTQQLGQIYEDNLIWSTCDLLSVVSSSNCDLSKPYLPYPTPGNILGDDLSLYPNYMKPSSVGLSPLSYIDTSIVLSQGLPPGHIPGWGDLTTYSNSDFTNWSRIDFSPNVPFSSLNWFAGTTMYTNPQTGVSQPRNEINPVNFKQKMPTEGWGCPGGLPLPGLLNTDGSPNQPANQGQTYAWTHNQNLCGISQTECPTGTTAYGGPWRPIEAFGGGSSQDFSITMRGFGNNGMTTTNQAIATHGSGVQVNPFGSSSVIQATCDGCPSVNSTQGIAAFGFRFQTMKDVIDFLNYEGLTISPITNPITGIQPLINYDTPLIDVQQAIAAYWSPANPQPAGSQFNQATNGVYPNPIINQGMSVDYNVVTLEQNLIRYCNCTGANGFLDTQINYCPGDSVWDQCNQICVSTTACTTLNNVSVAPLNFSGGCFELIGTGQTDTYSSLVDCELSCNTPTSATTLWNCTNTGCVTGTTGNYADLVSCQSACFSFSCDTTGCETYNIHGGGGSGGTYTDSTSCSDSCISFNCSNFGCIQQGGSGGTYSTEALCTGSCVSYECLSEGCESYVGSGFTYQELSACTGVCVSYVCEDTSGCGFYNPPPASPVGGVNYYGTGATDPSFIGSGFTSLTSCQVECFSWGCHEQNLTTGTTVYAFFDTSSMDVTQVQDGVISLSAFTSNFPGWNGNLYITLIQDERWLSWPKVAYSGVTAGGLVGSSSGCFDNLLGGYSMQWAISQGINANFYDNCNTATQWAFPILNFPTKGLPPKADGNDDILIVTFIDENGPEGQFDTTAYHCNSPVIANTPQYSACTGNWNNSYVWQPTFGYKQDYTGYTTIWESITATTAGNVNAFLYASQPTQLLDTHENFALHAVAAISKGNKPAEDGTWNPNTAPRRLSSGGILNGVPGLCNITDLTVLETQSNPYVLTSDSFSPGGYGKLDKKGWGYDVNFLPLTQAQFTDDLTLYLNGGITSTTGCVSAETLVNTSYPFSDLIDCQTASTSCVRWDCTNTGCVIVTGSTAYGKYDSLADCTGGTTTLPPCTSYMCNTTGCTIFNVPNYGTGGTFTTNFNCVTACTSHNCVTNSFWYNTNPSWPVGNLGWDGCLSQQGSGGTYSNYSACTASCQSWECESPCSGGTGAVLTGCTQYPNTGATHLVESACTATCQSLWYCVPSGFTNSNCGNRIEITPTTPLTNSSTVVENLWDTITDPANSSLLVSTWSVAIPAYGVSTQYDSCLNSQGHALWYVNSINCSLIPSMGGGNQYGGPYNSWAELIAGCNGMGITNNGAQLTLSDSYTTVKMAIYAHYGVQNSSMNYLHPSHSPCECLEEPCKIVCDNGSGNIFNVYPNATGPHATSGHAYNICCAVTYDCIEESETNSCSGRTIITGVYSGVSTALEWVSNNLPNTDLSTLSFETQNTPGPTQCPGPGGGAILSFEPMSYSLLNNGSDYYTWNGFIQGLIGQGLDNATSGMSLTYIDYLLLTSSGNTIPMCAGNCSCVYTPCHCIEIDGSGGTYTQLSDCESLCTCVGPSGTSWNCVNNTWSYEPICNKRPYMGVLTDEYAAVDWFRQFANTDTFATKKSTFISPIGGVILGVTHLNFSQVQANMGTQNPWQDCYDDFYLALPPIFGISFPAQTWYLPMMYVESISHPLLNGGQQYTRYNDFYVGAVNAGVTLNYNQSLSSACMTISSTLSPLTQSLDCDIITSDCCRDENCYCYELFVTGGTHNTEPDCLSACCPSYSSYTCDIGSGAMMGCYPSAVPAPGSTLYTGPTALADCTLCTLNPSCPCYSATSWNCVTGTTIYSCEGDVPGTQAPLLGANSPGTLGASGIPISLPLPNNSNLSFSYPFTASTITPGLSSVYTWQVETVMTTEYYWDSGIYFSATTFEIDLNAISPTGVQPCIGPNGGGIYRLISVSHVSVQNNTPYYSWADFLGGAQASGFGVSPNSQINSIEFAQAYGITAGFTWDFEPCTCTLDSNCVCVEVYGLTGQYTSQVMCQNFCCQPTISYNCTITGCIDPLDGSGLFVGPTALSDCENVCYMWECNGL